MYGNLSFLKLMELIASAGDHNALHEFHNCRTIFCHPSAGRLLFVDFVYRLKEKPIFRYNGLRAEILDNAYNLTISKFANLPCRQKSDDPVKTDGPDCRYYFRAFLNHVKKKIPDCENNNSAQMEMKITKILQNFVIRHFYLSCLECDRRRQGLSRRYLWKVDGRSIPVWMPSHLSAAQCRDWLKDHIDSELTQKEQIQAVVDRHLQRHVLVSLSQIQTDVADHSSIDLYEDIEPVSFVDDLATAVANEKADTIDFQRPAIQALGPDKLKELIHRIFEGITGGNLKAQSLAKEFALSDAAFSRFASTRWSRRSKLRFSNVPDLWSNTAGVLASNPDFAEAASRAGVLATIRQISESTMLPRS